VFHFHAYPVGSGTERLSHGIDEGSSRNGISAFGDGIYHNADEKGEKSKQNFESGAF
jgi:hypothetical protein